MKNQALTLLTAALLAIPSTSAVLITKRVTIQPIRVHSGTELANPQGLLYEAETDKIWSQAGIDIHFLPLVTITNATFHKVSSDITKPNSVFALAQTAGNGASANPNVLNLWFVKSIDNNPNAIGFSLQTSIAFGTLRPKNGMAIADSAFTFGNGAGMRDIIAHELGHNLGLYHGNDESGVPQASGEQNLMSRHGTFPFSLDDITPHGAMLSQLNATQIARAHAVWPYVINLPPNEQYEYTPATETEPNVAPTVEITAPAPNAAFQGLGAIALAASASDADGSVALVEFFTNGAKIGEDTTAPFEISWSTPTYGNHQLVAVATDNVGLQTVSATRPFSVVQPPLVMPENVTANALSASSIALAWTDACEDEDGYRIYRSSNAVDFFEIAMTGPGATGFTDSDLVMGSEYTYEVVAFRGGEESAAAEVSASTPLAVPATPENASAAGGLGCITLSWNPSVGATTYRVYRSLAAAGPFTHLTTRAVTELTLTGLSAGVTYYYRVAAINTMGESLPSEVFSATPLGVPAAPSNVTATGGLRCITLNWSPSPSATMYRIYHSLSANGPFTHLTTRSEVGLTLTGLTGGVTYYYRIAAINLLGEGAASVVVSAQPLPPPISPANFLVRLAAPQQIDMTWTDRATNETGYEVERSTDGVSFTRVAVLPPNSVSFSNPGLDSKKVYYYRVRAFNSAGVSPYSNRSHTATR